MVEAQAMVLNKTGLRLAYSFPKEEEAALDSGAIALIVVFGLIGLIVLLGQIVELSSLGNKRLLEQQDPDFALLPVHKRKEKWALFFLSFAFFYNVRKLCTVGAGDGGNISVLNGVRVLSMCWVVLGHAFIFTIFTPSLNPESTEDLLKNFFLTIVCDCSNLTFQVPGGFFSVDSFFFLSGFLAAYLML